MASDLSLLHLKILIIFCFLTMTFLFGMIPVIFIKYVKKQVSDETCDQGSSGDDQQKRQKVSKYKRILSFLSCFAAGVFLATCFLELLPNVRENVIKVLFTDRIYTGFPIAEFVMIFGLFIILVIEQIVLDIKERSSHDCSEHLLDKQPTLNRRVQDNEVVEEHFKDSYHSDHSLGGICDEPHVIHHRSNLSESSPLLGSHIYSSRSRSPKSFVQRNECGYSRQSSSDGLPRHDHYQSHTSVDHSLQTHSTLRAMLLLSALSLHSVFEGMTVGLQTERSHVINVFAALTIHKSILSFSLGMNLVQSKISVASACKSVITFSLASPVGVVIGIAITDLWTSANSGIIHGVLQGIASGTFLYIIFFEILPKEFNCELDRILKVLFLIIGYATITGILFISNDVKKPFCKPIN